MSEPRDNEASDAGGDTAAGGNPEGAADSPKPHSWLRIWIEVAGVWAIALAHPLYTYIASGPEALTSYGVRRPDLLVLIAVVSLLGPLAITLMELILRRFIGERRRLAFHGAVISGLLALVLWRWMVDHGWPGPARNLLPLLFAGLIAWLYVKTELTRNFAEILGLATVAVVVVFLLDYPIREEAFSHDEKATIETTSSETPVVIVVFDELPLAALERPDGTIDPRFRNFAKLADETTWYPGAVAVADQTVYALPSILTGRDPSSDRSEPLAPGLANHPDSLCRVAEESGYEVHAYEPITDLCRRTWNLGTRVTATLRRALAADDPAAPVDLTPSNLDKKLVRALNAPFDQPYTEIGEGRREAFEDFIAGLPAEKRSFSLLHSTLPHVYWMYLPDGRTYPSIRPVNDTQLVSPAYEPQVDLDAQQMMLQLQFTDRELGKLIRKMKADGTWDDALFVVTADHGASFQRSGSRRMVNWFNDGWILPVPLFIKYPGQQHGRIVEGTVDGRDLAPTVMEQLGLDPLQGMNGTDLTGKKRLPDRAVAKVNATIGGMTEMNLKSVKRNQRTASRWMHELLGSSFYALGGHPELLGRTPNELTLIPSKPTDPALYADVDTASDELPAYFQAALELPDGKNPGPLAIALNGRIAATTRAWRTDGIWYTGTMLPANGFRDGANEITIHRIGSSE